MARPEEDISIPAPSELSSDRVTIAAPEPKDDENEDGEETIAASPGAERSRDEHGRFTDKPAQRAPAGRKERRSQHPSSEVQAVRAELQRTYDARIAATEAKFQAQIDAIRQAHQAAPQQGQAPTDAMSEIDMAMAQEIELMQQHDPAKGRYDTARWRRLNDKRAELIADRRIEEKLKRFQRQEPQGADTDPRTAAKYELLLREYPEVADNRVAQAVGLELRQLRILRGGDVPGLDHEAAANVIAKMGLRQQRPARGNQQATIRRQGPPGGNDGGGGYQGPRAVEVPRKYLQGLNLPEENIRRATFGTVDIGE